MLLMIVLCVLVLLIGSIEDFKKREIADFLNFFFLLAAFVIRFFISLFLNDWTFLVEGVLGFLFFFFMALLLYYTGQWGGGDSKMLLGLGAAIGITLPATFELFNLKEFIVNQGLFKYLILIFLVGAIYATIWTVVIAIKNWKTVFSKIKEKFVSKPFKYIRLVFYVLFFSGSLYSLTQSIIFRFLFFSFSGIAILMYFLILLLKGVEGTAMIKEIAVSKLTEGDWVVEDVFVGKTRICGNSDLGLELSQIEELKKHGIKTVKVKQGIPFVPSFFVAYLIFIFL